MSLSLIFVKFIALITYTHGLPTHNLYIIKCLGYGLGISSKNGGCHSEFCQTSKSIFVGWAGVYSQELKQKTKKKNTVYPHKNSFNRKMYWSVLQEKEQFFSLENVFSHNLLKFQKNI